jgi:hypothetical protein
MSTAEIAYLTLILTAFAIFAATLYAASHESPKEPPAAPGE